MAEKLPALLQFVLRVPGGGLFLNFMNNITAPVRKLPKEVRVGFAVAMLIALLVYTGVIVAPLSVLFFGPVSILNILLVGLFGFTLIYFFFSDLRGRIVSARKKRPKLGLKDLLTGRARAPLWGWVLLAFGFLYLVWPFDIIPDITPLGYLEDLVVLGSIFNTFLFSLKLIRGKR